MIECPFCTTACKIIHQIINEYRLCICGAHYAIMEEAHVYGELNTFHNLFYNREKKVLISDKDFFAKKLVVNIRNVTIPVILWIRGDKL